jgi:uncharacterized protein YkwD
MDTAAPRKLRRLLAIGLGVAAMALALGPIQPAAAVVVGCPYSETEFSPVWRAQLERAVACEVNQERLVEGLPRVRLERHLSRGAYRHVSDMVRGRYVAHVSPSGQTPALRARQAGYGRTSRRVRVGEVIGVGWTGLGLGFTPRYVVTRWLWSAGHRRVILGRRYREMGVGAVFLPWGPAHAVIIVADFGRRR